MTDAPPRHRLEDRFVVEEGMVHLTGMQALVRLPLDQARRDRRAGRRTATFISGYEGSPLAGYDLELARRRHLLDEHDVVFQPGVNEELAATAVQGSQLTAAMPGRRVDGVVGLWYGKAPGLDRASDAIRHANLGGTDPDGGVLAIVGDDAVAKSSTVPSASEMALAELGLPVLVPADPHDVLALGLHGIAMSRATGLWVGMKVATNVADASSSGPLPPATPPVVPERRPGEGPHRHQVTARFLQPTLGQLERDMHDVRLELAQAYARANHLNRIAGATGPARIGIVAAGKTWLDVRQALGDLGLATDDALATAGVRLLRLGMVFPLDPEVVTAFADGLDEIVVVEDKRSFVEAAVKDLLYGRPGAPVVTGKRDADGTALLRVDAELDVDTVRRALRRRLAAHGMVDALPAPRARTLAGRPLSLLPPRTPYFCSGCPHNSSTKVPAGSLVGGGIGCHAMVLLMDPDEVGEVTGLTQMGGEGAQWIGMAPFLDRDHLFQNIGDGTFHHSGSLAVRAAVAAGVNITFKLLHNAAVAMTGGQRAQGAMAVADIVRAMQAEGVARIIVTSDEPRRLRRAGLPRDVEVWGRHRLEDAQQALAAVPGVTLLVHDQECAAEKRRKRKRGRLEEAPTRVLINERVCEGCGDCGRKSNCLSVQPVDTPFGRKTRIDQASCNQDDACLDGDCPSFITVTPGTALDRAPRTPPTLDVTDLPTPVACDTGEPFVARLTGIGGTGVLTLSQVLATAAVLAGRHVRTLDQTGLAQKGGAVVSDVKIAAAPIEGAPRAAEGECHLYLGCDVLVAANPVNLAACSPDRTLAVLSTAAVPTGHMVVDPAVAFPAIDDVAAPVLAATRPGAVQVDARAVSTGLFGHDAFANVLLLGAAYQAGALPVSAEAIEEALTLNGVAVEGNRQAFRRGRQAVADPQAVQATIAALDEGPARAAEPELPAHLRARVRATPGSALAAISERCVADLVGYQGEALAITYADVVERVRRAEDAVVPGATGLAEAVAHHLHRLLAYKDEYEVARLLTGPSVRADVEAQFGAGAQYRFRLHPPVLRALGMQRKIALGPGARPFLRLLARLRFLRGTPFDPFGRARVRRVERELVTEYRAMVDELVDRLTPKTHDLAVRLAALPDLVRGYEEVKLANVARYREEQGALLAELRVEHGADRDTRHHPVLDG